MNSLNLVIARFGAEDRDGGRPGLHGLAVYKCPPGKTASVRELAALEVPLEIEFRLYFQGSDVEPQPVNYQRVLSVQRQSTNRDPRR